MRTVLDGVCHNSQQSKQNWALNGGARENKANRKIFSPLEQRHSTPHDRLTGCRHWEELWEDTMFSMTTHGPGAVPGVSSFIPEHGGDSKIVDFIT